MCASLHGDDDFVHIDLNPIAERGPQSWLTAGPPHPRASHRTIALPVVVLRRLERHKAAQAGRRLAAGENWQKSDLC